MSVNRYAMVAAQMGEPVTIERRIFIGEELYVLASDYDALTTRLDETEQARIMAVDLAHNMEAKNNDLVDELAAERFEKGRLTAKVAELKLALENIAQNGCSEGGAYACIPVARQALSDADGAEHG